jgi:hypothetical protein
MSWWLGRVIAPREGKVQWVGSGNEEEAKDEEGKRTWKKELDIFPYRNIF